jgi:hypothetical protein
MRELTPLSPDLEAQLPKEIQLIRKFYFQLSEADKKKLEDTQLPQLLEIPKSAKDTKFCFECGDKIARTAKFCPECGTKQANIQEAQQPARSPISAPTLKEIYSKEKLIESDKLNEFLLDEKYRLLKKFNCNTIEEVITILEKKISEKKK